MAQPRLQALARSHSVLILDFDGTLAPIVANREAARMRRSTHALLTRVCKLYSCGVVSGRALADTVGRLEGAPVRWVFGSHGLEPGQHLGRYRRLMVQVRTELELKLADCEWLDIEDKAYSLALHFRKADGQADAQRRLRDAASRFCDSIRLIPGKFVLNLVPRDAPNKGDAVLAIQRELGAEEVLFVGDDVTDEHVFEHSVTRNWLCARIGRFAPSKAPYYLCDQHEIDGLLAHLIRLRCEHGAGVADAACAE